MRPYVICHMVTSVDGRVQTKHWKPAFGKSDVYERLHNELAGDAWMVGRTTGQEFSRRDTPYPDYAGAPIPREDWLAVEQADSWAAILDAHGKIAWGTSDVSGDRIVVVLTRNVTDRHLAGLRADGVSYIFGGDTDVDLPSVLEALGARVGIKRLIMEGGGHANGSMLADGLIDELSLVVAPHVDGALGSASLFDVDDADGRELPIKSMRLESHTLMDGGMMWLRYRINA